MKNFTITFASTGGITIKAGTEEEAIKKFNAIPSIDLLNELEATGIEMTDIFEEEQ